jgi:superfamily II DNA or RNA helicase
MITLYENATHVTVTGNAQEIDELVTTFRFRPDGYFFALSYQRNVKSQGEEGWDGYTYPLQRTGRTAARALRGRKDEIIRAAKMLGYKVDLGHLLPYPFAHLLPDDIQPDCVKGEHRLDDDQRRCICDWLKAGIGFNKVTVGGGKTMTFAGAAYTIKQKYPEARFLFITPSERLVRQVTKEMKKFLPDFDIGQCGGGRKEFAAKDMVVCTVAMLNKNYISLRNEQWFDTFMAILYDEVHHAGSPSSMKILLSIPAYFRLGASDSGKENDLVRFNNVRGLFGPMLNEVHSAPLIDKGRLARPNIYIVDIPDWKSRFSDVPYRPTIGSKAHLLLDGAWITGTYAGPVYEMVETKDGQQKIKTKAVKTAERDANGEWIVVHEPVTVTGVHKINVDGEDFEIESRWCLLERMYDRAIIQFKSRNQMIVDWVRFFNKKGWPTVVVATRTTHVCILEALLKGAIGEESVRVLIGEASPEERDATFEWFRNTPGSVLVTPLVKEGVSINEIRAMVVADYVSDYDVARQIIGRGMRPKKTDNQAHIVWFWDRQHTVLNRGCNEIFNQLERVEGFEFYHPCAGPETVFTKDKEL